MSENFCLQPYHIGERLLACFLNMSTDIVKEKFNIENFAEAIPEQSFSFERTDIRTDDQHKIDIVLKANDKFYAVITDAGKVYRNDAGSSLFQEDPFYLVETASYVKDILIINNNDEYGNCSYEFLILVLLDNSVIKLEKVD